MPKKKTQWAPGSCSEPKPQTFEAIHGDPDLLHGGSIVGGGNAVLQVKIILAPLVSVNDTGKKIIVSFGEEYDPPRMRSAVTLIKRSDPGGLARVGWSLDIGFMDMAIKKPSNIGYVGIDKVTLQFDCRKKTVKGGNYEYEFVIPKNAASAENLVVHFKWLENDKILKFKVALGKRALKLGSASVSFTTPMAELPPEANDISI